MRARILTLVVLLVLAGCSSVPSLLYKIEIQQGNVITQEMVDKLKPGMTRSQVRFALGSPMISDPFHENRWDYVYRLEQRGQLVEQRKLTVFFEDDKLVRLDGTFSPSVAFAAPQIEHLEPDEPTRSLVKEETRFPASDIHSSSKEGSGIPFPGETPTPSDVPAPSDTPALSSIAASSGLPQVDDAPGLAAPDKRAPRQVPSQAADPGNKGVDQPKE